MDDILYCISKDVVTDVVVSVPSTCCVSILSRATIISNSNSLDPGGVADGMRVEPAIIFRGHTTSVTALHFLQKSSSHLISGDESGELHLWDLELEEGECISTSTKSPILSIVERNELLYIHYKSGVLSRGPIDRLPHTENSFITSQLTLPFPDPISFCRMRLIGSSCLLFPGPDSCAALLADTRTGLLPCGQFTLPSSGMLTAVCPSNTGSFLSSYEDGSVARWEIRYDKSPIGVVKAASESLFALTRSPRGRVAVTAGGVNTICAVQETDVGGLRVLRKEKMQQVGVGNVDWRPDGKIIATAGWDGKVRLWSGKRTPASLLRPLASLRWHSRSVQTVCFSPNSTWLASGGSDRTIALWNVFQSHGADQRTVRH